MGVQKNATYKVHNGTDFDEINFKTILEQVKFPDGTSLLDFFNKGGTISGNLDIGNNEIKGNGVMLIKRFESGTVGVGSTQQESQIISKSRPTMLTLQGKDEIVGKADFSRGGSGNATWNKDANGVIVQRGEISINSGQTIVNLPIRFTDNYQVVANDTSSSVNAVTVNKRDNTSFNVYSSKAGYIRWIAVGE
ncbi:hypothetical protein JCM1393_21640 [Clostridium carnis]